MPNESPPTARTQLRAIAYRAMIDGGLLPDFSPAALQELSAIHEGAAPKDVALKDLRPLLWASVDNDDSRDLDQLSVAIPAAHGGDSIGGTRVLVAIADVAATVKKGSALDDHAATNTTSVYTAAQIFPMLPEKLSTDLTSLGENVDRAAVVLEMTVDDAGKVVASDVYRAHVKNHAKLAYNAVAAWLEGKGPLPPHAAAVPGIDAQLRLQNKVAKAMRKLRHEHGALVLETIQAHAVFDGDVLADLLPDHDNQAKQLIEDLMVNANSATVAFLTKKGFPTLRRVLRSPERWSRIVELANTLGEKLPPAPNGGALAGFLLKQKSSNPSAFADLSLSVVKLLGHGEYALCLPGQPAEGHFGLAVKDYTHSTAPNRRFPDLLTQRLVHAALAGEPCPYSNQELGALAKQCTAQEDNAAKVERRVAKSAGARLLASRIGSHFQAIVTGASQKGTWARIEQPAVEGKIVRGFHALEVGDRVEVELLDVNVEKGFIDFAVRGQGEKAPDSK